MSDALLRIYLNNREKLLIHKYWYAAPDEVSSQLLNKRRKTVDIKRTDLEDCIGFLSLECNHCNNDNLMIELNELCEKFEYELRI